MFAITLSNVNIQACIAFRFSIYKACQWKNCKRATKESIIYQKGMRDWAPPQIKKRFRPPPLPPSARALSSVLQHCLKCCVHLHFERHIKFAPMSNLVVLGWHMKRATFELGIIINLLSLYLWMVVPSIDIVSSCCSWFHLVDTVSS